MSSSSKSTVRASLASSVSRFRKRRLNAKNRPWTQGQLAEACGVSLGTIQKIEAGVSWPDWKTVLKIADTLNVNVDEFYLKQEEMRLEEALKIVNKALGINLQPVKNELHMDKEFFFSNLKHELDVVKKTIPTQVHDALEGLVEKIIENAK